MGITIGIAITSGIFAAFIASRLPHQTKLYDDTVHFNEVEYGDDNDKFNLDVSHEAAAEVQQNDKKTDQDN